MRYKFRIETPNNILLIGNSVDTAMQEADNISDLMNKVENMLDGKMFNKEPVIKTAIYDTKYDLRAIAFIDLSETTIIEGIFSMIRDIQIEAQSLERNT